MKRKQSFWLPILILTIILFISIILAACVGKYPVKPQESLDILFHALSGKADGSDPMTQNVVLGLRIPRILASVLVGGALSMSGASYQGIFKNPLVSPNFLGASSGACIGAALGILLCLPSRFVSILAFTFGILAVMITVAIPHAMGNRTNVMLVLSGIIVGTAMSSVLGFIKYMADPNTQLASITY